MRDFFTKVVNIIRIKNGKVAALCLVFIGMIVFLSANLLTEHPAGVFSFFPILFGQRGFINVTGILHGLITLIVMILVVISLVFGIFSTKEQLIANRQFCSFLILSVVFLISLFIPLNSSRFGAFGQFSIPDGGFGLTSVAILFSLALYITNVDFDKKDTAWLVCLLLLLGYSFLFTLPIVIQGTSSVFHLTQRHLGLWITISSILIAIWVFGMVVYQILGYPMSLLFDILSLVISLFGTIVFIVFAADIIRSDSINFNFVFVFFLFYLSDLIVFVNLWRRYFGHYPHLEV